ncbi:MAG: complex I NDUFA9 subunit family protein [Xanthobacteraceae bacterium]
MTDLRQVTVFGGTGFLGRRVVRHFLEHGFAVRLASRRPERSAAIFGDHLPLELVAADVHDPGAVQAAIASSFAVVNAVSLYVEHGDLTFQSVHVEAAARIAERSRASGVACLVHISGIGADASSQSRYVRSRGQGEDAVRGSFPAVIMIRPAVMFGPDDAFLTPLTKLLRTMPIFPMFGRGETVLQPAYVEDVAEAIVRALDAPRAETVYELGGPCTYSYKQLLRTVGEQIGARPLLVPLPFGLWQTLAFAAEILPSPPVTRNQVELMMTDNVASSARAGFKELGIEPRPIDVVLTERGQ